MNKKLFEVIGIDDFEGASFATCSTYEKAQKAKELLEAAGLEDVIEIVQHRLPIDAIEIDGELIEL